VLVVEVQPDSKADKAGVQPGDLVKEINRKPVDSVGELKSVLKKEKSGQETQLLVKRPRAGFVVIKIA